MKTYRVSAKDKLPLIEFMVRALHESGCRTLFVSEPTEAPFRITFETADGERMGIVAYAFLANQRSTKNRPDDEHRFQVKYGSRDGKLHTLWQDPYGLYTTLFVGINPDLGVFVGADPVVHSPTKFFISLEFKQQHVDEILRTGWHAWERESRGAEQPIEILVGGQADAFLRYIRFEREALGEDAGHRQLLAERVFGGGVPLRQASDHPSGQELHRLAREFELSQREVLDLIEGFPRLKMAVRGWVAEEHLYRLLRHTAGVAECERLRAGGGADLALRFHGSPLRVECKNVLRKTMADGRIRVDFQRTRASKSDPCSRYYSPKDFDLVAACTHSVTEAWEFRYACTSGLDPHDRCAGKLDHKVRLDERWLPDPGPALVAAVGA